MRKDPDMLEEYDFNNGIQGKYGDGYDFLWFHFVACQLRMIPLCPQIGQCQMISSVSDSRRARIDPVHSSDRQRKPISSNSEVSVSVAASIMRTRNDARFAAGCGKLAGISPVSSRK